MKKLENQTFNTGDILFKEGETSDTAFILFSGSIELSKRGRMKIDVAEIVREGCFGLLPMIDGKPRNYTAKARETSNCAIIPRDVFLKALGQSEEIIQATVHHLSRSLREATARLVAGGILDQSRGDI